MLYGDNIIAYEMIQKVRNQFKDPDSIRLVSGSLSVDKRYGYFMINAANSFGGKNTLAYQIDPEGKIKDSGVLLNGILVNKLASMNSLDINSINEVLSGKKAAQYSKMDIERALSANLAEIIEVGKKMDSLKQELKQAINDVHKTRKLEAEFHENEKPFIKEALSLLKPYQEVYDEKVKAIKPELFKKYDIEKLSLEMIEVEKAKNNAEDDCNYTEFYELFKIAKTRKAFADAKKVYSNHLNKLIQAMKSMKKELDEATEIERMDLKTTAYALIDKYKDVARLAYFDNQLVYLGYEFDYGYYRGEPIHWICGRFNENFDLFCYSEKAIDYRRMTDYGHQKVEFNQSELYQWIIKELVHEAGLDTENIQINLIPPIYYQMLFSVDNITRSEVVSLDSKKLAYPTKFALSKMYKGSIDEPCDYWLAQGSNGLGARMFCFDRKGSPNQNISISTSASVTKSGIRLFLISENHNRLR